MKNLRRILSLVLALLVMISFNVSMASAAIYTDVEDTHKYAEAINLLSGLGIVKGYETGKFMPEGTITRAEAATMMVRVLGLDDKVAQGSTIFPDVPAKHWASGYVNIAVANGIIVGFPDGTFHPEEEVTYEQIVKMIICAVGHELKADSYNGYPQGYIRAASEAKITKGISGYVGQKAPRGMVAQLIYNALEVEMMDAVSYSTGIYGTSYANNGKTLLRDYLEIEKVDAIVQDTYLTGETFSSRDKFIELEITDVYGITGRVSRYLYDEGDVMEFDEGYTDANIFLGRAITAYVGEDRDTGVDTIFAITVDSARNDEVEVTKDRFFADDSDEDVISYTKRITDKRLTELDLDRNVQVVVNGATVNESITEYFDTFDVMTLVDNNRDNKYDFIFVEVFDESEGVEFVVTEIEEDDDYYCFEGDSDSLELDYSDRDVLITIIRDGETADADDIEIGDVVTCLDTSRSIMTVYVSSDTVKGIIDEVDYVEDEYYINNKAYLLSPAFAEELNAGDYGTFYLNYQGKIAYSTVASTVSGGDYVFIANYDTETKFSKTTYLVQVVTEDGDIETYTLKNTKMKYVDHNGNLYKSVTAQTVYDYLTFNRTELSNQFSIGGYVGLARVKASSAGVISEIYMPGRYEEFYEQTKYAVENGKEYSEKRGAYGSYQIDNNAVAFRVDDSETYIADAIEVGTIREFFTDGDSYVFIAYGERGEDIEAVVITDGIATANYQDHAVLVTKVSQVRSNDEITTKITGIQNGKSVTYIIDPDENYDVEVGNIILVGENAEGYVSKLEKVANTTDDVDDLYSAFDDVDVPSDEDAGVYAGMVTNKTSKRFTIADIEDSFYDDDNTAYYLIDYTGRETTFAKSSLSAIKTTSSTGSYVIVRTYEDESIDVFVFRVDADEVDVPSTNIWDVITPAEPDEEETEAASEEVTVPTEATTAPTEPETQAPTEATTAPTEPETQAPTEATTAPTEPETQAPTEATTAPTEPETQAPTEATTAPTEPETQAPTEATTAPTEPETEAPTEATTAPTEPETQAPTEATTAPTEPETEAPTEATTAPTEPETQDVTIAVTEATTDSGPILAEVETKPTEVPTAAPTEEETEAPTEATTAPTEPVTEAPTEATTAPTEPVTEPATEIATEKKVTVDAKLAKEVLTLINAERIKAGLTALTLDNAVTAVSEAHGIDMATNKYLDQKSKDGSTVENRLTKGKVVFTAAAENLAQGKYSSQVIVDAWMKSEKHKANILNAEFTKVGIAVATALDGTLYWVVDFVK